MKKTRKKFDEDDWFFALCLFMACFMTLCITVLLTWE